MDAAKLRLAAGAGGAFFGFAGVMALGFAVYQSLQDWLGPLWAAWVVTAMLLVIASVCVALSIRPLKSTKDEIRSLETAATEAISEMPYNAVASLVDRRPYASLGVAMLIGYALVRDPEESLRHAQRVVTSLVLSH